MKLLQIRGEGDVRRILDDYFTIHPLKHIPIMVHAIYIEGAFCGYVATEDMGPLGGPHVYINTSGKRRIESIVELFKIAYCPLMKALGKEYLVTNCDREDAGTKGLFDMLGFTTKELTIAELKL